MAKSVASSGGEKWLQESMDLARKQGYREILPHHLVATMKNQPVVLAALIEAHVDMARIDAIIEEANRRVVTNESGKQVAPTPVNVNVTVGPEVLKIVRDAKKYAADDDRAGVIAVLDLVKSLCDNLGEFQRAGIRIVSATPSPTPTSAAVSTSSAAASTRISKPLDGGLTGRFCIDLTEKASKGDLPVVIGRDREIREVVQLLSRRSKNTPVLVGDPGVGKTSVIFSLAQRAYDGSVEFLPGRRILLLDLTSMRSSSASQGEFEKNFVGLLNEVKDSNGEIVLAIEGIHALNSGSAAADTLRGFLVREDILIIGETTNDKYRIHIEKESVSRYLQQVDVEEPSDRDTLMILRGLVPGYQDFHQVQISDDALAAAIEMSVRYFPADRLPDKAIDLLDSAAAKMRQEIDSKPDRIYFLEQGLENLRHDADSLKGQESIEARIALDEVRAKIVEAEEELADLTARWASEQETKKHLDEIRGRLADAQARYQEEADAGNIEVAEKTAAEVRSLEDEIAKVVKSLDDALIAESVGRNEIARAVEAKTGIKAGKVLEEEAEKLLHIEERMGGRLFGQDEAISSIADAIRVSRAGLADPNRPTRSFLFSGPSGTGKTETAKALAEFLFDDEQAMVRIDMSEFSEKHSVAKLMGAPPGYVGYDEGGVLTEAVRKRPYSVILFDEVEKANAEVFDVLLQVLDEGHLTDSKGKRVDFRNTVIILTSNLGSRAMIDPTLSDEEKAQAVNDAIRGHFRPEFLNRLDNQVIFHTLTEEGLGRIIDKEVSKFTKRMARRRIKFEITNNAKKWLSTEGYDPERGARPVIGLVKETGTTKASVLLLNGTIDDDDLVIIDHVDGEDSLSIQVEKRDYVPVNPGSEVQAALSDAIGGDSDTPNDGAHEDNIEPDSAGEVGEITPADDTEVNTDSVSSQVDGPKEGDDLDSDGGTSSGSENPEK